MKEKRTVIQGTASSLRCLRPGFRAAAVVAILLAAGCATGKTGEKSSQELYEEGNRLAGKKSYPEAIDSYRAAARTYRGADLDAAIQIALADAQFKNEDYAAAAESYAEFLRMHPHNAQADYAQLRIGSSWSKQMCTADRSQAAAHKAVAAYEALLRGYPRSSLLDEGRKGLADARRRIAEHELSVARFYERRGSYRAAAGRYEVVLQEYGDLGFAEQSLYELGRCYERLQDGARAAQLFEQLRRDFPQSRYLKEIGDHKG
ncbi:MAG TPA: outer membrane protein assembly factor BamD [bacterium]